MNTHEAIDLFYDEMVNEIFHANISEIQRDALLTSLKEVKAAVIETVDSSK